MSAATHFPTVRWCHRCLAVFQPVAEAVTGWPIGNVLSYTQNKQTKTHAWECLQKSNSLLKCSLFLASIACRNDDSRLIYIIYISLNHGNIYYNRGDYKCISSLAITWIFFRAHLSVGRDALKLFEIEDISISAMFIIVQGPPKDS